ncbi:MAG: alcohol dehydrogenase catalytic domain-containing protein [Deltaproteobacteria bacterium]|nr:alcohol dehydrogenase catalytic domain-containing protein [Deltaproteobacteria bacterium]
MSRALLREPQGLILRHRPVPSPALGEVVIRVAVAGICRTDIAVARGELPQVSQHVVGHESAGIVQAVGEGVDARWLGARVAVWPFASCSRCARCLSGETQRCQRPAMLGIARDGAFADHLVVHVECVFEVGALSLREAAYAEPVCAALSVLDLGLSPDLRGVILGDNRIAQLTALVLQSAGFLQVKVCDVTEMASLASDHYDFCVESNASDEVMAVALRVLRPGATLVLKSRAPHPVALDVRIVVAKSLHLVGANYSDFSAAIAWIARNRDSVAPLLGSAVALELFSEALLGSSHNEAQKRFFALDPDEQTPAVASPKMK